MPRPASDYAAMLRAADSIEPRLARAFRRAVVRMRSTLPAGKLEAALTARNAKRALAVVDAALADALAPVAEIARDAVLRGGRLGAERLKGRKRRPR